MKRRKPLSSRYLVSKPRTFRLSRVDPGDTDGVPGKKEAGARLQEGIDRMRGLQEKLYAQNRWAVLLIFQAMDAAGKDGTIKHVLSGINPQGCQVFSFKAPSTEELDHDFLWRTTCRLPERGRIGIFNRSYYEEVLVVRVHPRILERQRIPASLVGKRVWKERFESINDFERHLARNGTLVLKFFLHVSKDEQRRRFLSRLDEPAKNWKFEMADVAERGHWDAYMRAYEDMIRHTSTDEAPWLVVPSDHKWYARLVVADAVVERLERLGLAFPEVTEAKRAELAEARAALEAEGRGGARRRA